MDGDVYAPPQAEVADVAPPRTEAAGRFYVVARVKFFVLTLSTVGFYFLYWHYRNWSRYRETGGDVLPLARTIFPVFFLHELCRNIDRQLLARGCDHRWHPERLATWLVVLIIVAGVVDRAAGKGVGSPYTDVAGMILLMVRAVATYRCQQAINLACGDPEGLSNSRLTAANVTWIRLGIIVWLSYIVSLVLPPEAT